MVAQPLSPSLSLSLSIPSLSHHFARAPADFLGMMASIAFVSSRDGYSSQILAGQGCDG